MNARVCVSATCVLLALPIAVTATPPVEPFPVIPRPVKMEPLEGHFALRADTPLVAVGEARGVADYLAVLTEKVTGHRPQIVLSEVDAAPAGAILLTTEGAPAALGREGYSLTVSPNSIEVRAPHAPGLFYAVQTLRQLGEWDSRQPDAGATRAAPMTIPCVRIVDQPRYRWRGMLLDCCRHFMTKDFVKRYIDLLAYHKMNVLHWHLTEDQGWRIEIKRYPRLTEVGAWRGEGDERHGGFYTQEDIKEIVAYAAARFVTVVPEIEMPGHSQAALAAYPELSCTGGPFQVGTQWGVYEDVYCAGNDKTFEFLENVLAEVIELFPSPYIHIGGDECPKTRWKQCKKCQRRIQDEGLKDEHELQSYFIRRIEKFLNGKGRRIIGWDEILEGGLAPNATVQSWRGMSGAIAAASSGHDVISSPTSHCYLDYAQLHNPSEPLQMGFIDLERVYSFEPTPATLDRTQAEHVLGAEGNMWTEHAPQQRVDHQVFPRLCALAEVTWSPATARDWSDFTRRMTTHYRRLDAWGVHYFIEPPRCDSRGTVFTDSTAVALSNPFGRGEIRFTIDGTEPSARSPRFEKPFAIDKTTIIKAQTHLDDGRVSDTETYRFVKQRSRPAESVADVAPGLRYRYYEGAWGRLPDFGSLEPVASGVADVPDFSVRRRDELFAVRFDGYIEVPAGGVYTFRITSDDGSRLWIGDDLVVDHDGLHSPSAKQGQIILDPGRHAITIAAFQSGGDKVLSVEYEGPGIGLQPVPASALCHRTP